jgi:hypothetical protein
VAGPLAPCSGTQLTLSVAFVVFRDCASLCGVTHSLHFFPSNEEAGDEEDCKKAYDALGELLTATLLMNSENDPYFP